MDADEHPHLADYLDWYLHSMGLSPAHMIFGVRSNPDDTNVPLMRCNEIFNRYDVPRWSELWPDTDVADWRRVEQDIYVRDEDWVIHARIGDLVDFGWTGGRPDDLAAWMDVNEFDCVKGQVIERFAVEHLPTGQTPWELYPGQLPTSEVRVAMARGFWYVCDDGNLCPEFEQSAWDFPRAMQIHRFTYQVRPGAGQRAINT